MQQCLFSSMKITLSKHRYIRSQITQRYIINLSKKNCSVKRRLFPDFQIIFHQITNFYRYISNATTNNSNQNIGTKQILTEYGKFCERLAKID